MKKLRKIGQNAVYLAAAKIFPRVLQAVLIFYAARIIGAEAFGHYSIILSLGAIFAVFTDLGVNMLFTRELSRQKEKATIYTTNVFVIKLVLIFISIAFFYGAANLLHYEQNIMQGVYLYGVYIALTALVTFISAIFVTFERMHIIALLANIGAVVNLLLGLYLLNKNGEYTVLITALIFGAFASLAVSIPYLQRVAHINLRQIDFKLIRDILRSSLPFVLHAVFTTIYFRVSFVLLSKSVSSTEVGWYGAAFKIMETVQILPLVVAEALFPVLSQKFVENKQEMRQMIEAIGRYLVYLGIPAAIGMLMLSTDIIKVAFGSEFLLDTYFTIFGQQIHQGASLVLKILSFATGIMFINTLFVGVMITMNRTDKVSLYAAVNVVVAVLLGFILIPEFGFGWGIYGAALIALVVEVVNFILFRRYIWLNLVRLPLWKWIRKSLLAGAVMLIVIIPLMKITSIVFVILIATIVYITCMLLIRAIAPNDFIYFGSIFMNNRFKKD